jgi:hypothetical protein
MKSTRPRKVFREGFWVYDRDPGMPPLTLLDGHRFSYANGPENAFARDAEAAGWTVSKRGWPDFACWHKDGRFCLVEVKPRTSSPLRARQHQVLLELARYGVPCYRWDPETGFTRITPPRRVTRKQRAAS